MSKEKEMNTARHMAHEIIIKLMNSGGTEHIKLLEAHCASALKKILPDYVSKEDELICSESKAYDYFNMICEHRIAFQEIYAMRGEDTFIEKICSPIIEETEMFCL